MSCLSQYKRFSSSHFRQVSNTASFQSFPRRVGLNFSLAAAGLANAVKLRVMWVYDG